MADKSTIDSYDKMAEEFHSRNSISIYSEEYKIFCSLFGSSKNILELGCGTGRDANDLINLGLNYTGIDASGGMLDVARKNVPHGKFKIGDFYKLDFSDNSFDGFWAAAAFLHVPKSDIDKVLQEVKRILKPNGIGFISLKEKTAMDEGYIEETKLGGIKRYFAFYEKDEFKRILGKNGFEIIKANTQIESDGTHWLYFFVKKSGTS